MNKVHIDFETYNESSIDAGSWRYAEHPTMDILCLAYSLNQDPVRIYRPYEGDELPYELFEAIENGYVVCAWNVAFEYSVWRNHCVPVLGWPEIPEISWNDTAAKAAAHALPLALANCCTVLNLEPEHAKFGYGKDILNKLSKPQKGNHRITRTEAPLMYSKLYEYCKQDVVAERHIDNLLLDLKPHEADFWHIDQLINRRGIPIDIPSVLKIRDRVFEQTKIANANLPKLTNGRIDKITQVQRIVQFCNSCGVNIKNCTAQTVDNVLTHIETYPEKVQEKHKPAIEILYTRKYYGKSAVSKYDKMLETVASDGRVHYTMVYHGAHTGRWAGRLIQPHNFFKATIHKDSDVEHFIDCVSNRTIECTEAIYQPYIHAAASATRMMICSPEDEVFFIGDYNAIEARIIFWLAGDKAGLSYYYDKRDPYCEMASRIYGRKITKANEYERFVGKGIVLGAGFGLGAEGFVRNMKEKWNTDIDPVIAKEGIAQYRQTHFMVKKLWSGLESAAINAVLKPNMVFEYRNMKFLKPKDRNFLYLRLPSGRLLAYPEPKIAAHKTPWGEIKDALSYKVWDNKWYRITTHGGTISEHVTQGTARDVMADGMTNLEFNGFPIYFTVHDEVVPGVKKNRIDTDVPIIHRIMETPPDWAEGLPIKVEYQISPRYKK